MKIDQWERTKSPEIILNICAVQFLTKLSRQLIEESIDVNKNSAGTIIEPYADGPYLVPYTKNKP